MTDQPLTSMMCTVRCFPRLSVSPSYLRAFTNTSCWLNPRNTSLDLSESRHTPPNPLKRMFSYGFGRESDLAQIKATSPSPRFAKAAISFATFNVLATGRQQPDSHTATFTPVRCSGLSASPRLERDCIPSRHEKSPLTAARQSRALERD